MQVAFNTIAFPDSTLEQVATFAEHSGYDAIEFRTLGFGVTQVASDPALTDTDKVRRLVKEYGTRASGLATSVRFDQPFDLPVIGHAFGDNEKGVRMAKRMIDLAAQLEAPNVRVFAFEAGRVSKVRVAERIRQAGYGCRNTGVRLVLENGGSFRTAEDLRDLLDEIDSPWVEACYNRAVDPSRACPFEVLGDRLRVVRLQDERGGRPCPLGEGEFGIRQLVERAAGRDLDLVVEWPALWHDDLGDSSDALASSIEKIYDWMGMSRKRTPSRR